MVIITGTLEDEHSPEGTSNYHAYSVQEDSRMLELKFWPGATHGGAEEVDIVIDIFEGVLCAQIWSKARLEESDPDRAVTLCDFREVE